MIIDGHHNTVMPCVPNRGKPGEKGSHSGDGTTPAEEQRVQTQAPELLGAHEVEVEVDGVRGVAQHKGELLDEQRCGVFFRPRFVMPVSGGG